MKKLNTSGIAHTLVLVAVIVVVSVSGVGYMVASHASNCLPTNANPVCPASPVSGPVASASCAVENLPENPSVGDIITPTITIGNPGSTSISPSLMLTIETSVNGSKTTVTKPFQAPVIKAGEAYHVIQLDADRPNPYTAELSSKIAGKRFYTVTSSAPAFSCVGKMNLPSVPKAAVALAKNANCSIDGIIGRPVAGQIMQPIVRIQYTGAGNYVVGFNASWLVSGQGLPAYPDPKQPAGLQMGGQTIASGQVTSDIYLPRYVTQTSADGKGTAVIRVNGDVGATQYSCSFTVFLPAK